VFEKINEYEQMADAGRSCIKADRLFIKGYFRLATALKAMNDLPECIKTLESGLAIQSGNADLKKMKMEVIELQRGEQVATYCAKANELLNAGDIGAAHKTLDLASRLDAGNSDIEALMKKVRPVGSDGKEAQASLSGPSHKEGDGTRTPSLKKPLWNTPSALMLSSRPKREPINSLSRLTAIARLVTSRFPISMALLLIVRPFWKSNRITSRP
jgi:tetratricopeptide (TPR) repeat protein